MFVRWYQDDLIGLKVTNTLHHLSFKRGIEVLRQNNFSQVCLKRRPSPDEVPSSVLFQDCGSRCRIQPVAYWAPVTAAHCLQKAGDIFVVYFEYSNSLPQLEKMKTELHLETE